MIDEKTAAGDVAPRARQGQGADVRAKSRNSVNTEIRNASPAPAAPAKRRRRRRIARRSRLPKKVLRVTTYERLGEYLQAFAAGHFHLLILVGSGAWQKAGRCARCWAARAAGSRATPPPLACT